MMEKTSFLVSVTFIFILSVQYSLMVCLSTTSTSTATNITTDQSALLALKSHITLDPHNRLANNWSTSTSPCNWIGVHCSTRHHRVAVLNLSYMGLRGTIPPHIGNLSFLLSLDITNNSFHGDIPKEIGYLRRLQVISFTYNDFTGNLPEEIGKPANLKFLDMGQNRLSGSIPASIFNISSLERIDFTNNILSGNLPANMCHRLPKLQGLYLSSNQFYGQIPSTLYECSQLQILSLRSNKFSGPIPREIGNLTMLKILHLGGNNLTGQIPQQLGNLHNLEELLIERGGLTGTIPFSVFNISSLKLLGLWGNKLTGNLTPAMCSHLPMLERLYLWGNKLTGTIPREIGNFTSLMNINLGQNSMTEYGLEGLVSTRSDVYSYGIMLMETFTRTKPTDEMFDGDLSLKLWVSESLPSATIQVIDANLLKPEEGQLNAKVQCVSSIMQLALNCCAESPQERINMREALANLKKIRHQFMQAVRRET